jgi:hypothetical protein
MTTGYMGYILIMFTHRGHAQARVCKRARYYLFAYLWTVSLQICDEHTTNHNKKQGLCTFHVHAPRASMRVRARMCERVRY